MQRGLFAFVLLGLSAGALAQETPEPAAKPLETRLAVGGWAPQIDAGHWCDGEAVAIEAGTVYVLELWASWSLPSHNAFRTLNDLQRRFRDDGVVVVAVTGEPIEVVDDFLDMTHAEGSWRDRIEIARNRAVPAVFVIGRDSRLEWFGVVGDLAPVVEAVATGEWDRAVYVEVLRRRVEYRRLIDRGKVAEAMVVLDSLIETDVTKAVRHRFEMFSILVTRGDDTEAAYAVGRALVDDHWNDALLLNEIAWFIVDDRGVRLRDLDFAGEVAHRSNELTESRNPAILDTVARVYYEKGQLAKAISWQDKAARHARGTRWETTITDTLDRYEAMLPAF
jgi:hypothetical protein